MTGVNQPARRQPARRQPARRQPARRWVRLRWVVWRAGWVLALTAFWSSGKFRVSTIGDLVVAVIVVAVFSFIVSRVKRLYEATKQACKMAWREGNRQAMRQLARAIAHLRD